MVASRLFSIFPIILIITLLVPTTWGFSKDRLARRISSVEGFSNEEDSSSQSKSSEEDDSSEYKDVFFLSPSQVYTQIIPMNKTNSTGLDVYLVKALVYEVGVLTDVPENDTDEDSKIERIDISLFNRVKNSSSIDLEHIPIPVQANISGDIAIDPLILKELIIMGRKINETTASDGNGSEDKFEKRDDRTDSETDLPILNPIDLLPKINDTN